MGRQYSTVALAVRSRSRPVTLSVVAGAQFLAVMSTSVVSVALPTIGRELQASTTALEWIVDAYVLVFASLLVAGGVLSDRRGRKPMFVLGVVLFGTGSLLAGLAPTAGLLIAARVIQGLGPAIVLPGSLAIISAIFRSPRERAAAIGLWSASSGLALAVGPAFGGALVDGPGWRWVFLINVPLCALLVAAALVVIPAIRPDPGRSFDLLGAVLTVLGVGGLAFALIEAQARGWGSPLVIVAAVIAVLALAGFVAWELYRVDPLVDVRLFRIPAFTAANVAGVVVFFAFIGAIVYFSAYFQDVQGRSAADAGLLVLPIGAALALTAPLSGRLTGRVGARLPMLTGLVICGGATLGLLRLGPHSGAAAEWWDFALIGLGAGLALTPMTATAVGAVRHERAGMASAVHNAMRQLGQVLGVAVLGALVYTGLGGESAGGRRLGPAAQQAYVDGLHHALWVAGLALLGAAALVALLVPPGRTS
jgi:DHA2 family methylenomycin A resistance protein-like MFS transporter